MAAAKNSKKVVKKSAKKPVKKASKKEVNKTVKTAKKAVNKKSDKTPGPEMLNIVPNEGVWGRFKRWLKGEDI